MDVKNLDHGKFLVALSSTESTMLNEMALDSQQKVEAIFANLMFYTIGSEHAEMMLGRKVDEHKAYWDR